MLIIIDDIFTGILCHDIDGNLLLQVNEHYYYLNINNKNELEWIHIHDIKRFPKVNNKLQYNNIKNTFEENINNHENDSGSDIDIDENLQMKLKNKFLPEEKLYYIDNKFNTDIMYSKLDSEKNLSFECLDWTLDSPAIYDIIIFGDTENKTVAYSIESKDRNHYKVSVSKSGEFTLNVTATNISKYITKINNQDLMLIKLDNSYIIC